MILTVTVNDSQQRLNVPDEVVDGAGDFFRKLDADMDCGWRMSREFVAHPDLTQRCQIVADRLLTALEGGHRERATLFAAYILARLPRVTRVAIDAGGEVQRTSFHSD
jgi:hypothetical protein